MGGVVKCLGGQWNKRQMVKGQKYQTEESLWQERRGVKDLGRWFSHRPLAMRHQWGWLALHLVPLSQVSLL